MQVLMQSVGWLACMLVAVQAESHAAAEQGACSGISEQYEDALARIEMIDARRSILADIGDAAPHSAITTRINNEVAELSRNEHGLALEEVVDRYLVCRFDLELGTGRLADLVNAPQTVVASNCMACEGGIMAANDSFETLYSLARQGSGMGTLREMLEERSHHVDWILACEQSACREPVLKQQGVALTVADYLRAMEASTNPEAWAAAPIVVAELPDYLAMDKPIGQYPVTGWSAEN